jgi:hypothetical protein
MKPEILTLERLRIIEGAIERHGGEVSLRYFQRNHGLRRSIIKEAEESGFIESFERKPRIGRPSILVKKVSKLYPTELPPWRCETDDLISIRHWNFAWAFVFGEMAPGMFSFKRRAYIAYQKTFPNAKSVTGARASSSRLLRKSHVRAAIQWAFADVRNHHRKLDQIYRPRTESEIRQILKELGSY